MQGMHAPSHGSCIETYMQNHIPEVRISPLKSRHTLYLILAIGKEVYTTTPYTCMCMIVYV